MNKNSVLYLSLIAIILVNSNCSQKTQENSASTQQDISTIVQSEEIPVSTNNKGWNNDFFVIEEPIFVSNPSKVDSIWNEVTKSNTIIDSDTRIRVVLQVDHDVPLGNSASGLVLSKFDGNTNLTSFLTLVFQDGWWKLMSFIDDEFAEGIDFKELSDSSQTFVLTLKQDEQTINIQNGKGFDYSYTFKQPLFKGTNDFSIDIMSGPKGSITVPFLAIDKSDPPISPTPTSLPLAPLEDFMKGVAYSDWSFTGFSTLSSDRTISEVIRPMGVTWIEINHVCLQDNPMATEIKCGPEVDTPSDYSLRHAIQVAHMNGIRVMLRPGVSLKSQLNWDLQTSFFSVNEELWDAWFASYTQMITHYAKLAQEEQVDAFSIGYELDGSTHRENDWRKVASAVREIYSGPLVYSSNPGVEDQVQWWDAVDYIGIDAYYPLTNSLNPTVDQLTEAWSKYVLRLEKLSRKWNRPVVFTEVGYKSVDGSNITPNDWKRFAEIDLQEQADCYSAVFKAFSGKSWWHGVFWWQWFTNLRQGGPYDETYTANNKPAEDVLRKAYGAPPRPTPTPSVLIEDPNNVNVIYSGRLTPGWDDYSWSGRIDFTSTQITYKENPSIKVNLKGGGAFSILASGVNAKPYTWLEFYINSGDNTKRLLSLNVTGSDNKLPEKYLWVNILNPDILEGGTLRVGQWQRVRIPLTLLMDKVGIITRITLQDQTGRPQGDFYLANIRLVGANASALVEDPMNEKVIYSGKVTTGWDNGSWDANIDLSSTQITHQEKPSIEVNLKRYGAFSLYNTGINAEPYTWLEFYINPGENTNCLLSLYIVGSDNQVPSDYLIQKIQNPENKVGGYLLTGQWQRVRIPLSSLMDKVGIIKAITLQDDTGSEQGTFYLAEIRLVGSK